MAYLVDFEKAIENHDTSSILHLWEEYTSTDEIEEEDYLAILKVVKASDLHEYIGRHVERGLNIWNLMKPGSIKDEVLRLITDLQMTDNEGLRAIVLNHLTEKFGEERDFLEKMRLVGLRGKKGSFKGAISQYLLLNHMRKGNFVFHTAGWGVGEIMDISMLREQLGCEFDYIPGRKEMAFKVAFATLIPIPNTHFLAQRFGNADDLEVRAKKNPLEVIRMLLRDLGPKTAADIKDELYELVIPEGEWNKWWQAARFRIKKDTRIESPADLKKPFSLLKKEIPHEERLTRALEEKPDAETLINMMHAFLKDFSDTLKNEEFKVSLLVKLKELISFAEITTAQELQVHFFLQDLSGEKSYSPIEEIVKNSESIPALIADISIQAFKRRTLVNVRKIRKDWEDLFLNLLFTVEQNPLREYILGELIGSSSEEALKKKLLNLSAAPEQYPELTIWYFQKIMGSDDLSLVDVDEQSRFFEGFLILLSYLERKSERRDLIKKMHGILSGGRYALVRKIMKLATIEAVQEFLLLVTKCYSLADHDIQIFYSLAEVVHPSLKNSRWGERRKEDEEIIWTTREGYITLQKKIEQIGTVETVENAKEIAVARAHGDLRENAEFKAALERRERLQAELKCLSDQLNKCRIITDQDVDTDRVSVGTRVTMRGDGERKVTYSLLGPWDANPEENTLSFQSKLAQTMIGLKRGDSVDVQGKTLTVEEIQSAL